MEKNNLNNLSDDIIDKSLKALESFPAKYQEATKKLNLYTDQSKRANEVLTETLTIHKNEKETFMQLKLKNSQLETKIKKIETENFSKEIELSTLFENSLTAKQNIRELQQKLENSKRITNERARTIEEYKSKMKKYEDEILKSKLNQIESCSQMKKLNNLKQNLIEKKNKLVEECTALNNSTEIEILKATAALHQSTIDDLQTKLSTLKKSLDDLKAENELKYETMLNVKKRDVEQMINERSRMLKHRIALENKIELIRKELNL